MLTIIKISEGGYRKGLDAVKMAMLRIQNAKPMGPIISITVVSTESKPNIDLYVDSST